MGMVKGITFYVGPDLARPLQPPENLMLKDDGALCRKFRQALLNSEQPFTLELRIREFLPLYCNWAKCGETAGVAAWWRGNVIEAVTGYLGGVDQDDEDLVELALAAKPFPIPLHRWHEVLNQTRPIYATFLLTPASAEDRVIPTAAPALAFSFFSMLGMT